MRRPTAPCALTALAGAAFALVLAAPADAQVMNAGPTRPPASRVAAFDPATAPVPQSGATADRLRESLKKIRLPPGFRIELLAVVPGARSLAVAPSTDLVVVGTRSSTVWALAKRSRSGGSGDSGSGSGKGSRDDGSAEAAASAGALEVRAFAPSLRFRNPNAVCWAPDGTLVVVETNRASAFPNAARASPGADVGVAEVVPQGRLVPPEEESSGHGARVCRIGPDDKLYVALGQPFNVQPRDKLALYAKVGIGGIVRLNRDGSGREVYATGIRNSVGIEFNPKDGTLWFTDNQTDGMGDEIPMGEINRATAPGQFFGYPYVVAKTRITQHGYDKDPIPAGAVDPQVMTDAHAADLGLAFYTGTQFPAAYRNGFFSAQHGSWNRTKPIGARVLFTALKDDGTAAKTEVFAEGWLDDSTGAYSGRPVDVAVAKDGSLLVSDDHGGAVYRITYGGR